jgi:FtsZ-binding cell division protein ZapB
LRKKLDELREEEDSLDAEIASLNGQIQDEFLENEELKQFHYITFEDCLSICKSMNKTDPNKGMLVVSAPKGTSLEVG